MVQHLQERRRGSSSSQLSTPDLIISRRGFASTSSSSPVESICASPISTNWDQQYCDKNNLSAEIYEKDTLEIDGTTNLLKYTPTSLTMKIPPPQINSTVCNNNNIGLEDLLKNTMTLYQPTKPELIARATTDPLILVILKTPLLRLFHNHPHSAKSIIFKISAQQ